ncbi:MAG TPA: hypothetical protein VJI71_00365 [Candidatus Norongarragalinales archaeon]|nr:hypothetical protein [Candidatus Norongarragalinales archaeon]
MNMNVKLTGITEQIIQGAIKSGIAKTKTDAIVIGLLELENRYRLLEKMEDKEDSRDAKRILREIKEGKQKVYTKEEFEKRTGAKL